MSPFEVAEYLQMMKDLGVMSGGLEVPTATGVLKISVAFEPKEVKTDAVMPGGWKASGKVFEGPKNLDQPFEETVP